LAKISNNFLDDFESVLLQNAVG